MNRRAFFSSVAVLPMAVVAAPEPAKISWESMTDDEKDDFYFSCRASWDYKPGLSEKNLERLCAANLRQDVRLSRVK